MSCKRSGFCLPPLCRTKFGVVTSNVTVTCPYSMTPRVWAGPLRPLSLPDFSLERKLKFSISDSECVFSLPCSIKIYKIIHLSRRLFNSKWHSRFSFPIFFGLNPLMFVSLPFCKVLYQKIKPLLLKIFLRHDFVLSSSFLISSLKSFQVVSTLLSLNNFPPLFPREMLVRQFLCARWRNKSILLHTRYNHSKSHFLITFSFDLARVTSF